MENNPILKGKKKKVAKIFCVTLSALITPAQIQRQDLSTTALLTPALVKAIRKNNPDLGPTRYQYSKYPY